MKRFLLLLFISLSAFTMKAQGSYTIQGDGQGKNGSYRVKVVAMVDNVKSARDVLKYDAVHGVLFRGFVASDNGGTSQQPLVADPNVEQTKADFFRAFWKEKAYERYVSMVDTSFRSVKVKKQYEVSAILLVDKESLQHYLEDSGIIKGFSDLW